MAFCGKCGTQFDEGTMFCPACGAPTAQAQAGQQAQQTQYTQAQPGHQQQFAQGQNEFVSKLQNLNNTADSTAYFNPQDIAQNKAMAILSYLGILWLIPFFGCKQSPYVQYHCKQGFNLLLTEVAYTVLSIILSLVIRTKHYVYGIYIGTYTPGWVSAILWIISIPIFVLVIIGIINVVNNKAKELPIIGKIQILK